LERLLEVLLDLGRQWAEDRAAQVRRSLLQALEHEQRRLFDALLLLGLGLIFSLLGLIGLIALLWWCTPEPWRLGVMAGVLAAAAAAGAWMLAAARRRLGRSGRSGGPGRSGRPCRWDPDPGAG